MREKILKKVCLNLFLAALLIFCCTASVYAGTDISDSAVDSITIGTKNSDGTVNAYVDFTVTVNFSEDNADGTQKSGLDIESGDTITVRWEAPDGVTFTGYTETIDLYQDGDSSGTLLGTAVVTTDGVTITFNNNVNNLQHVNGSVTFTIRNYGNPTSEEGGTGTITSGDVEQNVTINHTTSTGIGAFGAKGGAYYTTGENKIDWWLWINGEEKSDLTGTITITDTLPDTETFDSFTSFALRNGGSWNWGVYTLDNFNSYVGSFVYDESTRTITITIPASFVTSRVNGTAAVLHFTTTSTAEAGTKVRNTANWTYYENGSTTPIEETHTGSLTVPSTSGSISGVPKGTIQITKVVNNDTDYTLEGVHFRVYKVNSETDHTRVSDWYDGEDYAEIVTGSDGIATLSGLDDGYYEIVEVIDSLPNWIDTSDITSNYVSVGGTAGTATTISNSVVTDDITATKNWVQADGTTADTSDHPTVYFQLYRNGTALTDDDLSDDQTAIQAVKTASGESSATVTWENLPLYDNSGNAYTYTVKEVDADGNDYTPDGYSKTEDGLTVTNTALTSVSVNKVWEDENDQDGLRPDSVQVQLYADGEASGDAVTLNASNSWSYTWTALPGTADGEVIDYTVKETSVPDGYEAAVSGSMEDGFTITNTHTPETTSVSGTKTWNDSANVDGLRPSSIVVSLLADGEVVESKTVSASDDWSYSFTDLPKYSGGNEITYSVEEAEVSGYTTEYDGYNITNIHKTEQAVKSVSFTKIWVDENDSTGIRPSAEEFAKLLHLYNQEDQEIDVVPEVVDNQDNTYTITYSDLPEYDANGNEINYYLMEDNISGDYIALDADMRYWPYENGKFSAGTSFYNIRGDLEPLDDVIQVSVNKVWNDGSDAAARPKNVYVQLYAQTEDGEKEAYGDPIALNAGNDWTYTWAMLPNTDSDGGQITYTVEEENTPENYLSEVSGDQDSGFTITNTYKVDIPVEKRWADGASGTKADIVLKNGDEIVDTVELNESNDWQYTFTDLPKYDDNGNVINYTVDEETDSYRYEITSDGNGGWIITNYPLDTASNVKTGVKTPTETLPYALGCLAAIGIIALISRRSAKKK